MNNNPIIMIDITAENAQQYLIDESFNRLVIVDFWAGWCAPCKQLMPVLEKLATEYEGQFLLAKVNADEQEMITQQLGVRSLPTVMFFKDGQPIDGFTGAQTENSIRELLEKYLPKPWDLKLPAALALMEAGETNDAAALLRDLWQDSKQQSNIGLHLAQCFLLQNRLDEADEILKLIPMVDHDAFYQQVLSQLSLQQAAGNTPELESLLAQLAKDPDNLDLQLQTAIQYWQEHHAADALKLLIDILKKDKNFNNGAAKKTMLDIFASLGNKDPLVVQYQRQLFSLLY